MEDKVQAFYNSNIFVLTSISEVVTQFDGISIPQYAETLGALCIISIFDFR